MRKLIIGIGFSIVEIVCIVVGLCILMKVLPLNIILGWSLYCVTFFLCILEEVLMYIFYDEKIVCRKLVVWGLIFIFFVFVLLDAIYKFV